MRGDESWLGREKERKRNDVKEKKGMGWLVV